MVVVAVVVVLFIMLIRSTLWHRLHGLCLFAYGQLHTHHFLYHSQAVVVLGNIAATQGI